MENKAFYKLDKITCLTYCSFEKHSHFMHSLHYTLQPKCLSIGLISPTNKLEKPLCQARIPVKCVMAFLGDKVVKIKFVSPHMIGGHKRTCTILLSTMSDCANEYCIHILNDKEVLHI